MTASSNTRLHLTQILPYGTLRSSVMMALLLFQVCDSQDVRLLVQMKVKFSSVTLILQLTYLSQMISWMVTRMGLVEP